MAKNFPARHVQAGALLIASGLGLLSAASAKADYLFTTLAGVPEAGPGWYDGSSGAARFNQPLGVAEDSAGNVYVADAFNHTIRKITPAAGVKTLAGLAGSFGGTDGDGGAARFNGPSGVALDSSNNVYVADTYNHTIRKITSAGTVTTLAGLAGASGSTDGTGGAARFNYPCGVAVDGGGNVYVADSNNHTIRKITPAGAVTTLAGTAGSAGSANGTGPAARFNNPFGVAVDRGTNVYVADSYNDTIRKITPARVVTTLAGLAGNSGSADGTNTTARFYNPGSVAVDSATNVYVADTYNHTIRKVTPAGVVTTPAGLAGTSGSSDGTNSAARFYGPCGVAMGISNVVYVADTYNHTIRKIAPTGDVMTLAAFAVAFGDADGTGGAARFQYPRSAAADTGGNVYVADTYNHTIRKITRAGSVTTLAGLAGTSGSADGTSGTARFYVPSGVAVDGAANVYVADAGNNMIRKISPAGVVTTLAGMTNDGIADGMNGTARFYAPYGVVVDSATNVYVADSYNHTIRKVTPAGVVTTVAGLARTLGSADGTNSAARFYFPCGVAADNAGTVYVADLDNDAIRKITPAGAVTTLAGLAENSGSRDGTNSAARFYFPYGVAVDVSSNLYVADTYNHTIRKGNPALPDIPVVDLPVALPGVVRHLDVTNLTTGSWSWSIVRRPSASSAQLSSATERNPTFAPDVPDLFIIRFEGRDSQGRAAIGMVVINDATPPTLGITSPTNSQRCSNAVFAVTGTASDNVGLSNVRCQINGRDWTNAVGTTTWTASVRLTPGTNLVRAFAVDTSGQVSATSTVSLVYAAFTPLVVQLSGKGTVTPNYNGRALEIWKMYSMTATAGSGFAFTNWTGGTALPFSVLTNQATVQFVMQSNLTLTAVFTDTNRPTLAITNVTMGQRVSNSPFTVKGRTADNVGVSNVWYQLNSNGWSLAAITNAGSNWSAAVTLQPGTNRFEAYAQDASNNRSASSNVSFIYVVNDTLRVSKVGQGTLTPNLTGALLPINLTTNMTATGTNGHQFSYWITATNWLDGVTSTNAKLTFVMQSNLTLTAVFTDTNLPTLTLTNPTANARLTTAVVTVKGTAKDNAGVKGVWYQLNTNAWGLAATTNVWTNWTATVGLIQGTNVVRAYAIDRSANPSLTNSVTFTTTNAFQLQLRAGALTATGFGLQLDASPGLPGWILLSTNSGHWTRLTNFLGTNVPLQFLDPTATNHQRSLYRAVTP